MNLSNIWSSVKLKKKEHIYSTWRTISTNKRQQLKSRNHQHLILKHLKLIPSQEVIIGRVI